MSEFELQLASATAAILNHFDARPGLVATSAQIHDFWNEWPAIPAPLVITETALQRLEEDGLVERIQTGDHEKWRALPPHNHGKDVFKG